MVEPLNSSDKASRLIVETKMLLEAGKQEAAAKLIEFYLQDHPVDQEALKALAHVRLLQGKREEATRLARRVYELEKTTNTHQKRSPVNATKIRRNTSSDAREEEFSQDDLDYTLQQVKQLKARRNYFNYSNSEGQAGQLNDSYSADINESNKRLRDENIPSPSSITTQALAESLLEKASSSDQDDYEAILEKDVAGLLSLIDALTLLQKPPSAIPKRVAEEIDREVGEVFLLEEEELPLLEEEDIEETEDPLLESKADREDQSIYDQLDWDLLDDFTDDYEEDPERSEFKQEIQTDGGVSRAERARQVAIDLGQRYTLDHDGIDLLSEIFEIYRWGKAKTVIECLLISGITTMELRLAHDVRLVWRGHEEFSNCFGMYPYPAMPWPLAVEFVRAFYSLPSVDEMEVTLNDIYSDWYSAPSAVSTHISFYGYLRDRLRFRSQDVLASPSVWLGSGYESQDDEYYSGLYAGFNTPDRKDIEKYGLIPKLGADAIIDHVAIIEANKEVQEFLKKEKEKKIFEEESMEKLRNRELNRVNDRSDINKPTVETGRGWIGNQWHGTARS